MEAVLLLKYDELTGLGDRFAARPPEMVEREAQGLTRLIHLKLEGHRLARARPPPQRVLSRRGHWKSVRSAYATGEGLKVDNLRVLLVDDVLTTAATLDACYRALKKAGAAAIYWV
jgi:predicted amidophosphoribosyltransferase